MTVTRGLPTGNRDVIESSYGGPVVAAVRADRAIGHRGAKSRAPENSLEGFHWVASHGIGAVECDVRATADGVLICSHDPTAARLGGPPHLLAELPLAAVREIRLHEGTRIPTLAEVLDVLAQRSGVVIEIKNGPREPDFSATRRTAVLTAHLLEDRRRSGVIDDIRAVSSFDAESVVRFAAVSPHFGSLAALVSPRRSRASRVLATARELRISQIHPHATTVLREPWVPALARRHGIEVTPWTVNNRLVARAVLRLGAVAVISDDPVRLALT